MIRFLAQCLVDPAELPRLKQVIGKIEKCSQAVGQGLNLADLISDSANHASLRTAFGDQYEQGLQLLVRTALHSHSSLSFAVHSGIEGERKLGFIHKSAAGWRAFDIVLQIQHLAEGGESGILLVNPARSFAAQRCDSIAPGALVTVHLRQKSGRRSRSEERLAAERLWAVFETVQTRVERQSWDTPAVAQEPAPAPKARLTQIRASHWDKPEVKVPAGKPTGITVVVNKLDTFVHAGNAQLIVTHVRDYPGKVEFFVLRGEKRKVQLDADSIWGAEIRNGETVLFEFFGPKPQDLYVRELARKVNKYTQMDKAAGE
jgi:hypothetical protein